MSCTSREPGGGGPQGESGSIAAGALGPADGLAVRSSGARGAGASSATALRSTAGGSAGGPWSTVRQSVEAPLLLSRAGPAVGAGGGSGANTSAKVLFGAGASLGLGLEPLDWPYGVHGDADNLEAFRKKFLELF